MKILLNVIYFLGIGIAMSSAVVPHLIGHEDLVPILSLALAFGGAIIIVIAYIADIKIEERQHKKNRG